MGSICLHHNCYLSCEPPNAGVCSGLPSFNICKTVTTVSGPHQVCGSDTNLGSECDPTVKGSCPQDGGLAVPPKADGGIGACFRLELPAAGC